MQVTPASWLARQTVMPGSTCRRGRRHHRLLPNRLATLRTPSTARPQVVSAAQTPIVPASGELTIPPLENKQRQNPAQQHHDPIRHPHPLGHDPFLGGSRLWSRPVVAVRYALRLELRSVGQLRNHPTLGRPDHAAHERWPVSTLPNLPFQAMVAWPRWKVVRRIIHRELVIFH